MHPLWDGEAMYAEVPREMLAGRNFLYPTLNYAPFIYKPPLYLWANALSMALFGQGTLAFRLPSVLMASLTVFFVYLIAARFGRKAGLYSGAVMATLYGPVFHASTLLTDTPLTLFAAAAIYFFLEALEGRSWGIPGVYACLGLAVMTKGFIGAVFPGIAIALFILSTKRLDMARRLASPSGILLFIAITLPWHIMMEAKHPGFLNAYVIDEQLLRSVPTPWFILVTIGWLMPWSFFLVQALARTIKGIREGASMLAFYWGVGGLAFLCLSSSRMEYHTLPVLPAFAVMVGIYWAGLGEGSRKTEWGAVLGAASLLIFSLAAIFAAPHVIAKLGGLIKSTGARPSDITALSVRVFAVLSVGSCLTALLLAVRRHGYAFSAFLVTAALMLISARPAIELAAPGFSSADAAMAVASVARPEDILVVDGDKEYELSATFNFYTGKKVYILSNDGMHKDRFGIDEGEFRTLWSGPKRAYFVTARDPKTGGIAHMPSFWFKGVFKGNKTVYSNGL